MRTTDRLLPDPGLRPVTILAAALLVAAAPWSPVRAQTDPRCTPPGVEVESDTIDTDSTAGSSSYTIAGSDICPPIIDPPPPPTESTATPRSAACTSCTARRSCASPSAAVGTRPSGSRGR